MMLYGGANVTEGMQKLYNIGDKGKTDDTFNYMRDFVYGGFGELVAGETGRDFMETVIFNGVELAMAFAAPENVFGVADDLTIGLSKFVNIVKYEDKLAKIN